MAVGKKLMLNKRTTGIGNDNSALESLDLGLLLGKLDAQMVHLASEMKSSLQMQEIIKEKLELVIKDNFVIKQQLQAAENRLHKVEQPLAKLQSWQQRAIGILSGICLLSVFVGEAARSFIEKLFVILR